MNDARYLWTLAGEIAASIEHWLKVHEQKTLFVRFKKMDLLRLTRLQVWSWRYKVDIDEILSLTLPYLRKSLSSTQKTRYGLGVSISALTGVGNEKILVEALAQKYPGAEHRDAWRQREQRRQLDTEHAEELDGLVAREAAMRGIFDCESPQQYLQAYRARVLGMRAQLASELGNPKRRRKHYRGSPWI